jgi:tetratricopeptide (TPR) repeat protein
MAAALNACGYDEGLEESAPVRKRVRAEMNQALAHSEEARAKRDKLCLFIAQHRMTGTDQDIAQYISLSLYLTLPPALELSAELAEMPPDSTQVADVVPLLRDFAKAVDLNGIWLTVHRTYDQEADQIHDPLSDVIVSTNLYLKMPASAYSGQLFVVVIEPMLSPRMVNARIYGTDYVVVVSPSASGAIPMNDVRHTYLHYVIEPLLFDRSNALGREQPVLREIRDAPLAYRFRSDTVALTVECLIKAIEARTMDTGIPEYKIPANADREQMPLYFHERQEYQRKVDEVRAGAVAHDMRQGFVLTQYFYEQLIQFEKDPSSLSDTIGEMVYSMDVDQQVHRARQIDFDKVADTDVLMRSAPHQLTGLDLAEAQLASGDVAKASALARQTLATGSDSPAAIADSARAHFILARAALLTGHPEAAIGQFQKTLATSKNPRQISWSHIYLGRMLDLDCKRDEALAEYQEALKTRDGQQDTRLAAERGIKMAYAVNGDSCQEDAGDNLPGPAPAKPRTAKPATDQSDQPGAFGQNGTKRPQ